MTFRQALAAILTDPTIEHIRVLPTMATIHYSRADIEMRGVVILPSTLDMEAEVGRVCPECNGTKITASMDTMTLRVCDACNAHGIEWAQEV